MRVAATASSRRRIVAATRRRETSATATEALDDSRIPPARARSRAARNWRRQRARNASRRWSAPAGSNRAGTCAAASRCAKRTAPTPTCAPGSTASSALSEPAGGSPRRARAPPSRSSSTSCSASRRRSWSFRRRTTALRRPFCNSTSASRLSQASAASGNAAPRATMSAAVNVGRMSGASSAARSLGIDRRPDLEARAPGHAASRTRRGNWRRCRSRRRAGVQVDVAVAVEVDRVAVEARRHELGHAERAGVAAAPGERIDALALAEHEPVLELVAEEGAAVLAPAREVERQRRQRVDDAEVAHLPAEDRLDADDADDDLGRQRRRSPRPAPASARCRARRRCRRGSAPARRSGRDTRVQFFAVPATGGMM